mgnify:CR=1 FL=1
MAYTTISKHTDHFNTKLYTGNGSNGHSITGVGFQPDMVWIKERNGTNNHEINDVVRGVNYQIYPNLSNGQTNAGYHLTAFGADGFTVGSDGALNTNNNTYASWNWKAGNSAGSTNNNGTIATTVSVNTTAGFSIVKWTGTGSTGTLGHGLGAIPDMIWVKKTSEADSWFIWHEGLGSQGKLNFNNNSAVQNDTGYWNNTLPTNQVFSVTSNGANNATGQVYIAYCFTRKIGYSRFGSYTGNGTSSDGTFVYTGFKPSFVLGKVTNTTGDWYLWDNKRLGYNRDNNKLMPSDAAAETTQDWFDIYSNGFKFYNNSGDFNYNNYNFIYMAIGQSLVGSNKIPCTAR